MLRIAQRYDKFKEVEIEKMNAKPKTYNGPAVELTDPKKAAKIRKKEMKARKNMEWQGEKDIEMISQNFMRFLTTPTALA